MEINGYPDYLIYDDGRVWSKKRKGRFLKHWNNDKGYHQVELRRDEKHKTFLVSRLVALHYIPNPDNKPQVDHINRDKDNNHVSNLRWATGLENMQNRGMRNTNTSGHEHISYNKASKLWSFEYKKKGHKVRKYSKTKTEALCAKFAFLVLIRARNEYSDVSF